MRCARCGNENAEANRFCGTCGAPLAARVQSAAQPSSTASVRSVSQPLANAPIRNSQIAIESIPPAATHPVPLPPLAPRPEPRRVQGITGPSFLGLNQISNQISPGGDGPSYRDRHDSSEYQPLETSGGVDYLLDDDEEPKRGGVKLFLVVVVIATAIGIGYLRWMRGNFDFLGIKPAPVSTSSDAAPNSPDSSSSTSSAPNTTTPTPPASAPVTPIPTDSAAPAANADGKNSDSTPAASQAATPPPASENSQPAQPDAAATPNNSRAPTDSATRGSASNPSDSQAESDEEETPAPAPAKSVARKPAKLPKPSAAKPLAGMSGDSVAEAERYIYGRGVAQDCDHGLRLLKPAAGQQDPRAMISLGALYSTGTCTPRDLPTAYRWFAMALHKQPDNQVLQNNLQRLWSQMTQPERQLAIKLSQ